MRPDPVPTCQGRVPQATAAGRCGDALQRLCGAWERSGGRPAPVESSRGPFLTRRTPDPGSASAASKSSKAAAGSRALYCASPCAIAPPALSTCSRVEPPRALAWLKRRRFYWLVRDIQASSMCGQRRSVPVQTVLLPIASRDTLWCGGVASELHAGNYVTSRGMAGMHCAPESARRPPPRLPKAGRPVERMPVRQAWISGWIDQDMYTGAARRRMARQLSRHGKAGCLRARRHGGCNSRA